MSFTDLTDLKREYRSTKDDIINEFYIPLLKESTKYRRAVGYFSSSVLIQLTHGLSHFIKKNGRMELIVSPMLSESDIIQIEEGYQLREMIEKKVIEELKDPIEENDIERFSWIAYMIANGTLDIKIAYMKKAGNGIYHEKVGIFTDIHSNSVAFSGSLNETYNAMYMNYESFDAFYSWRHGDADRVIDKINGFSSVWNNRETSVEVFDFPEAAKNKILGYQKGSKPNFEIDVQIKINEKNKLDCRPRMPEHLVLYEYQKEAVENWGKNDYCGIFDMATGTGKTLTSIAALIKLVEEKKKVVAVIVCPYQHLVEQWVDDLKNANINPIVGYSRSKQKDWKKRLSNEIIDYNLGILEFFCFITTNATFITEFVQEELEKVKSGKALIVDEAHNAGATRLSTTLNSSYIYRLALSATIERHNDIEGTKNIFDFFGDKCIEYDIERAIQEEKLTPYYYHPITIQFEEHEHMKYLEISKKISRSAMMSDKGESHNHDYIKILLIQRSRIVAGAINKIHKLKELMRQYSNDSHILVYCGAARTQSGENSDDLFGEKQIVEVSKILGNELGIINTHFTSNEDQREREDITKRFANRDPYQALIAIKCLDEGINIPSIKTAYILASSSNPKEYIQRRGRVLRKFEGKHYATIYDFITIPSTLESINHSSEQYKRFDASLIKKEIKRIKEFGGISLNPATSDQLIKVLSTAYDLDLYTEDDENEY